MKSDNSVTRVAEALLALSPNERTRLALLLAGNEGRAKGSAQ
jgi:hypothetical protein